MLTPKDYSLPDKFPAFRGGQFEVSARVAVSQKYIYMLDAPTGVGKSLIAATVQRLLGKNILYVCTTKQLQDQLLSDFPYARTLKGRSNYPCLMYRGMFPRVTAEDCRHSESHPCDHKPACPYMIAKQEALRAPVAVLNTAYFLTEANYVGTFSGYEYVVIDEFDTTEDMLMNFIEVLITQRQLDNLRLDPPKFKTKFESWVEWSKEAVRILEPRLQSIERAMEGAWATVDFTLMREAKNLSRLVAKLKFFIREVDKNWVWYPSEDRWSFKPVWIAKYSHNALWKHAKKVLGMSATILDPFQVSRNIGLEVKSLDYRVLPSPFPKENRPVYYEPVASVIKKEMGVALPALAGKIAGIMDKYKDDKILVHTVSYAVRNYLRDHLDSARTITHDSINRAEVLESYKASERPLVLLSPSMDRGVDLPDDQCRVVVIAKCPYPDLGDPQVNRRVHASVDGNSWYAHKTVSKIIQMAGRGVRNEKDYADTYILDSKFGGLYTENKRMFPPWFKEALIL